MYNCRAFLSWFIGSSFYTDAACSSNLVALLAPRQPTSLYYDGLAACLVVGGLLSIAVERAWGLGLPYLTTMRYIRMTPPFTVSAAYPVTSAALSEGWYFRGRLNAVQSNPSTSILKRYFTISGLYRLSLTMRLLKLSAGGELIFTKDLPSDEIPPYAILSHTWGKDEEEVSFEDITKDKVVTASTHGAVHAHSDRPLSLLVSTFIFLLADNRMFVRL
jgi:hypothetical protein